MANHMVLSGRSRKIFHSIQKSSLISAQFPERSKLTVKLSASKELPSMQQLEDLWLMTMDEIAE